MSATRRVGSDHVIVHDERLIVISRAHMEAWDVRTYRQTLIRFEDRNWRIVETNFVPPESTRYTLVPWDLSDQDVIGRTIEYGPEYVVARDRDFIRTKRARRASGLMRIVAPFTGFLSSRIKNRLEASYGIDPMASTKQSVIMETMAILCGFVVTTLGIVTGAIPFLPFLAISLALLPDAAIRWDRVLAEQRPPPGFYEWIFRRSTTGR